MKSFQAVTNEIVPQILTVQQGIKFTSDTLRLFRHDRNTNSRNFYSLKYLGLVTIFCLSIVACKKDKVDNSCHNPTMINQIKSGDIYVYDVTYTENCLLAESVEPSLYKKFTYDSQSRLTKMEQAFSFNASFSCVAQPNGDINSGSDPRQAKVTDYSDFEYSNDGKLSKKLNYYLNNGNALLTTYQTYEYVKGLVSKLSVFNPDNQLIQFNVFEYDSIGNVSKSNQYLVEHGGDTIHKYTSRYRYDDKINPFIVFNCIGEPGKLTNQNNITFETTVAYYGNSEQIYETSTTYEYNALGLPVKSNGLNYVYGE